MRNVQVELEISFKMTHVHPQIGEIALLFLSISPDASAPEDIIIFNYMTIDDTA